MNVGTYTTVPFALDNSLGWSGARRSARRAALAAARSLATSHVVYVSRRFVVVRTYSDIYLLVIVYVCVGCSFCVLAYRSHSINVDRLFVCILVNNVIFCKTYLRLVKFTKCIYNLFFLITGLYKCNYVSIIIIHLLWK